ncbi:MAG TPA: nucleotidyltransferase domain-containing protein [Solirubrobacteraceae bacterium]
MTRAVRLLLARFRGPVAQRVHVALARAAAAWLRAGNGAAVYVRGSVARGEAVSGLSDIDLVAVAVDRAGPDRRRRRLGVLGRHVSVGVYTPAELAAATSSSVLTHGDSALYLARRAPADELGLRARPPLPDTHGQWRRVAGPERRPPARPYDAEERRTAVWLELQYWWRHAGRLAADPARFDARHMTVKLLADPARAVAWLEEERLHATRRDALDWLRRSHPEEAEAVTAALRLEGGGSPAGDELDVVLGALTRLTASVAAAHRRAAPGVTRVRLARGPLLGPDGALPLADWRARCAPAPPDEHFRLAAGDPARAADLGACVPTDVLRRDDLLVMPGAGAVVMRGVQSAVSDPVSFALVEGRDEALFCDLPGWGAHDCARRAVAEHRSWLTRRAEGARHSATERALGLLITASRAATFLESIEAGEPRLPLTASAAVAEHESIAPAFDELVACRRERRRPEPSVVRAVEAEVRRLPAYGGTPVVAA